MATNPTYAISPNTVDQSGEPTGFRINLADFVALDPIPALLTNLITALDTELVDWTPVNYVETVTRRLSTATVGAGNREDKVELKYYDNVTLKPYLTEIGCRQGDLATSPGSDIVPEATWAATKTAFEALVKSPDGNAVTLAQVRIVGRNV